MRESAMPKSKMPKPKASKSKTLKPKTLKSKTSKRGKPDYAELPYRPCAGLCVINREGLVLIGRRADGPEHIDETHVWQMPQGGIDEGEKPYPAALRELFE